MSNEGFQTSQTKPVQLYLQWGLAYYYSRYLDGAPPELFSHDILAQFLLYSSIFKCLDMNWVELGSLVARLPELV